MIGCIIKECPCRTWINCSYYNSVRYWSSHSVSKIEVLDWYKTHFRIKYEAPDVFYSG